MEPKFHLVYILLTLSTILAEDIYTRHSNSVTLKQKSSLKKLNPKFFKRLLSGPKVSNFGGDITQSPTEKPKKFNDIPKIKSAVDLKVNYIQLRAKDLESKKWEIHKKPDKEDEGDTSEEGEYEEEGEFGEEVEKGGDEGDKSGVKSGDEGGDEKHHKKKNVKKVGHKGHHEKKHNGNQHHRKRRGKGYNKMGKKYHGKHGGKHKGNHGGNHVAEHGNKLGDKHGDEHEGEHEEKGKKEEKDDKVPRYPPLDRDKLYEQGLLIYMRDFRQELNDKMNQC